MRSQPWFVVPKVSLQQRLRCTQVSSQNLATIPAVCNETHSLRRHRQQRFATRPAVCNEARSLRRRQRLLNTPTVYNETCFFLNLFVTNTQQVDPTLQRQVPVGHHPTKKLRLRFARTFFGGHQHQKPGLLLWANCKTQKSRWFIE